MVPCHISPQINVPGLYVGSLKLAMVVECINTSEIEINKVLIRSLNPPHPLPPPHTQRAGC